jgi:subtilisin family serine protease
MKHLFKSFFLLLGFGLIHHLSAQPVQTGVLMIKWDGSSNHLLKSDGFSVLKELEIETGGRIEPAFSVQTLQSAQNKLGIKKSTHQSSKLDELSKWYRLILPFHQNQEIIQQKWRNRKGIRVIEPRYIRTLADIPNDPILAGLNYDYYERQGFYSAWDIQRANSTVLIGIVDSGVDYNHTDLTNKKWVNVDEIPGNGIDDDQNGWIDDIYGWDFWQGGEAGPNAIEDNDPKGDFSDHGTHVAGIAAAEANNNTGLAGAGYNARFMAIKAGGTKEYPRSIAYGYEGILYAAINGAQVINCSWGGNGASSFEFDVVQAVLEMGSVIVAAAGNDNQDGVYYPAAYEGVIAVGAFDQSGSKSSYSNYGYEIDVLASGSSIRSTTFNNAYNFKTGTSMASPFVAGLAALLVAQRPTWNPDQIRNQIRISSSDVYPNNSISFDGKLGRGHILANATLGAVKPGFVLESFSIYNADSTKLKPNQVGTVSIWVRNVNPLSNSITVSLESQTPGFSITQSSANLEASNYGDIRHLTFSAIISDDYDPFQAPILSLRFNGGIPYQEELFFTYDKLLYEEHVNKLKVSISADATLGFINASEGSGGVGFIPANEDGGFDDSNNILYSAGLALGFKGEVADRLIGQNEVERNIVPTGFYSMQEINSFLIGNGMASVDYGYFPKLDISTKSFSTNQQDLDHSLWVNYVIKNPTLSSIDSLFVGFYVDFDIDDYSTNSVLYRTENQLLYTKNQDDSKFVGLSLYNATYSALAINNLIDTTTSDIDFGIYYSSSNSSIYNGFTKQEKWNAIQAELRKTQVIESDVSMMLTTGPFSIPANDSISVGYLWTYATSLSDLNERVVKAREQQLFSIDQPIGVSIENEVVHEKPGKFQILQSFPNPFNPTTNVQFEVPGLTQVTVQIFNSLGQQVMQLANSEARKGIHTKSIDFSPYSSGVYFIRIQTRFGTTYQPVTLIK